MVKATASWTWMDNCTDRSVLHASSTMFLFHQATLFEVISQAVGWRKLFPDFCTPKAQEWVSLEIRSKDATRGSLWHLETTFNDPHVSLVSATGHALSSSKRSGVLSNTTWGQPPPPRSCRGIIGKRVVIYTVPPKFCHGKG